MSLLKLCWEFLKIGLFAFGGGYGSIPFFKDAVIKNNWLTEAQFYDFIGICESTPGPIFVNLATYIGTSVYGPLGGALATLCVCLPAFIIMLILTAIISKFLKNKIVKGTMNGIQPTVIGLIISAGFVLLFNSGINTATQEINFPFIGCFIYLILISFTYKSVFKKKMPTIMLVLIGAILGILVNLV